MKFVWLFLVCGIGLCDAEKYATRANAPMEASYEGRQHEFSGQPAEADGTWDQLEIQKLHQHTNTWKRNLLARPNGTEVADSSDLNARQLYPGLPPNPGESNELPNPTWITIAPIPSPAPGCHVTRGQSPSLKNCGNYLNCWDDVVIEQSCPNGLLFNDVTLLCDFDYNVNCGTRPLPGPKPTLPPGSKYCPDINGRYRSSTNCSEFYVCVVRSPIKFSCPRGLVYNDVLNVCDYLHNVDCKGAAVPKLPPPTTNPPQQPTLPPQEPTWPPQPSYPPQQPSYPPQQPSYPPQQPSYPPQQPSYPPQQPSYPGNPWLGKSESSVWKQLPMASETEDDKHEEDEQGNEESESELLENPWNTVHQTVPASLSKVPCEDGSLHKLNEACASVVVCRNGRPQLVNCPLGYTYDRSSDNCKPFSIAKC